MRVQKVIRAQGDYAKKGEDIKDGDLVTIHDAGQIVNGDYGDRMVFKVETRNGDKNLSFNQKSMNNLIDAFGDDTVNWVGKKAKIWMVKAMVSGKFQNIVYLSDIGWMMADDGTFFAPNGSQAVKTGSQAVKPIEDDIPVIEGDINTNDLPF
jgi:hypothetical protein